MSKVFRSIAPGSSATVEFVGADGNVTMYVRQNIGAVDLSSADAPAIALTILEAAPGPEHVRDGSPEAMLAIAHGMLRRAVDAFASDAESKAKEAAEWDALALLGRKLYNADRSACDLIWEDLSPGSKKRWIDRMGKAREIIEATK